ncbi:MULTISPECIES: PLP-dependent aspartate aminotransferase family protein [unclassified Streptococcus]|uniref:trans-sulfuration enzyme family protein n=1 Tax=unclassified Streptococcus TaxID=2608887 RepID=UPI001072059F|nr:MULTISPECIES: PLP-dependent aspartate aminotransferase family protein [unclassified Streptococcus]MBF0786706.1 PLP-dependent transferase [Streptococcus sp. 19428wC2_LYSM12]MCQ9211686.1 PLP-dependent aspartate aminotransferase family protein [Streptococcus sp. B01]MCQ9213125.1 PLP-dependent aspartate aminotransferase family protein [Streptococcus sp. O1]TFV06456.1 PLP-dependent transferase [Streptococcus sp. LYSM12]
MEYSTKAIHGQVDDTGKGAVTYPVYLSSTFLQPNINQFGDFVYSRSANPTRASLEQQVAGLEGARYALATATGMAATAIVFELLNSGDRILLSDNVYGGTWQFVNELFESRNLSYELVPDFNHYDFSQLDPRVKAIFLETPTNPLLHVTDLEAVIGRAKAQGLLVIVDNTFMTSYLQRPLDFGADIVVYSATKYYAGHSDILAGLVVTNREDLYPKLKATHKLLGAILSPFDAFLLSRGMKTLPLRLDKHQENTQLVAEYLNQKEGVQVFYTGLLDHPGHAIQERQARGHGGVLSFLLDKEVYDLQSFIQSLKLFGFAVSLGGVESLICHPATMIHESYNKDLQDQIGIRDNLLRLAVGIEAGKDLIDDLENAFHQARK